MHPFRLTERDVVVIDNLRWVPSTLMEGGIALLPESGGVAKSHSWDELTMLWVDQRMRIEPEPCKGLPEALVEVIRRDLGSFTDEQRNTALRRHKYIRLLEFALSLRNRRRIALFRPVRTERRPRITLKAASLDRFCERVARFIEPNGVADAPSGASLLQWYGRYKLSGRCLSALIPLSHLRGNRDRRLSPIVIATMNRFARAQYQQPERPRPKDIFSSVCNHIRIEAVKAGKTSREVEDMLPDIRSFYRVIEKLGSREKMRYREGAQKADRTHRIVGMGPRYQYIGQAIQIDSTELPIVARDPKTGLTFKQVTLTIAIDLATRAIIGFYVGLEKGFATIQETLRMAMLPKTWVSKLEGIDNKWIATVKPEVAFTDHGMDYRSNNLVMVCGRLNIHLTHTPVGSPDLKGTVERSFREIKESLFKGMPGSLFKNGERNIEYDASRNAKLTLEQINWAIVKFIVDVYMVDWNDGIEDSPNEAWRKLSEIRHPEMAPSIDHLIPLLSATKEVPVRRTGCEWMALHYGAGSRQLQALIDQEGPGKRKYPLNIDTMDVGRAYLLVQGRWLTLAASDPRARGRNVHDHLVIRAEAQSRKKKHQRLHQADMDEAVRRLHAPGESIYDKRDKIRDRSRKARFLVEEPDNLTGMKTDFVESVDPASPDSDFDDFEPSAAGSDPATADDLLPEVRPSRPVRGGRKAKSTRARSTADARRPEPIAAHTAAAETILPEVPEAAPVSVAAPTTEPTMPSVAAQAAAVAMPRRRRFSIVDFS